MRIILDTSRYLDLVKDQADALKTIQGVERIFVPFVVLAELRAGFLAGQRSLENERILSRFLNSPRTEMLFPDEQTTHHYARLQLQLRKQGTPIPTNDLWVASLSVQYDLTLFDRDRHFDHLPQLARVPD